MRPDKHARRARSGRRSIHGVRPTRKTRAKQEGPEPYDWAVDVAGEVELAGQRLLIPNRAGQKIRAPLRVS
jgi:hypothetical protein